MTEERKAMSDAMKLLGREPTEEMLAVAKLVADHCAAAMALSVRDRETEDEDAWFVADDTFNKLEMAFRDNLATALSALSAQLSAPHNKLDMAEWPDTPAWNVIRKWQLLSPQKVGYLSMLAKWIDEALSAPQPASTPDVGRLKEIERFLKDCEAVGFDSDPIPKLVGICRELSTALAALSRKIARLEQEAADHRFKYNDLVLDKGRCLQDIGRRDFEIKTLRKQLDASRAALEPFAKAASSDWARHARDEGLVSEYAGLIVRDLRRAAAAYRTTPHDTGGNDE